MRIKYILSAVMILAGSASPQFFVNETNSMFSDIKAHSIGDVLTVYIMESANAARESEVDYNNRTDVGTSGGVTGNLTGFLPVFGASSAMSSNQTGSEGTRQTERLTGKISAVIVGQTENGLFEIEGKRLMEVNGEKNIMMISGLVRSRDIEEDNVVYSYKIANASIRYSKGDDENEISTRRPGRFTRIAAWSFSVLLTGFAIFSMGAL